MKKKINLSVIVLLLAGMTSCEKTKDKVNEATEFNMNYSAEFTIPSSTLTPPNGATTSTTQPIDFSTPEISTESAGRFASESTTKDLIAEIKMTEFNITNSAGNLNYLKSFSIFLKTSDLGDVLVASKTNIPQNISSLNADLSDANIKDYIFRDKIQFRINVVLVTGTGASGDQKLKTSQTIHVKGKRI